MTLRLLPRPFEGSRHETHPPVRLCPGRLPHTPEILGHFCQMSLFEHDGPTGQVHLDGLPGAPLFFSRVSDLVTYPRLPDQSNTVLAIYVSDMGADDAAWLA
jgi:copper chaperone NosL